MSDALGPIAIPDPPTIAAFPLRVDYGAAREIEPLFYVHRFDAPGLKTEQRYLRGTGARRFRVRKAQLTCHEYETLRDHWNQAQGSYARFPYRHPVTRTTFTDEIVRYADPVLNFSYLAGLAVSDPGLTLVSDNVATPGYTSAQTDDGIASAALLTALRQSEQQVIPLITITPRTPAGAVPLYLSDRRVTVDANTYLARLLDWSNLTQSINQNNGDVSFSFGNADGVWMSYFKTISLKRAMVTLAFYQVASRILFRFWSGYVRSWQMDTASRAITMAAADGVFSLTLPYPTRQMTRTCWKEFKSPMCPYTGPIATCDKSWENCVERGMTAYFGAEIIKAQDVRIKDNSTGTWGFGRSSIKSVTISEDTIYQRVMQEVWTDTSMIVNCDVAAGRDESEFYSALGIVSEGPISGYSTDLTRHLLDNQPPHDPQHNGGWRGILGTDPAGASDFFGLSQAPFNTAPPGSTYAAGTAFAEIRRTDEKGLQLSKVSDRKMQVLVTGGLGGWTWSAPGNRQWTMPLANCVWVAVNAFLRGLGMKNDYSRPDMISAATMESFLRLDKIVPAAAICDTVVDKLVGAGTERQFPFRAVLREQKPLRDWLEEILQNCLGYYYFVNGKLAIDIRINSSVLAPNAFQRATVIVNSFTAQPREAGFNHITVEFGDSEFNWAQNAVSVYDINHATAEGVPNAPRFKVSRLSLVGCSNKSQASRIAITKLKEELGGATTAEQEAARLVAFKTTLIALGTLPGDVASYDDASLPDGRLEFRCRSRTINSDFSIDIQGDPSTDSMYDKDIGPKPDDVPADPVPAERFPSPQGLAWFPNRLQPFTGDPMYGPDEWNFELWQDYSLARTGDWEAVLWVSGEQVVNQFQSIDSPLCYSLTWSTGSGGSIPGGHTYYVAIAQRDSAGGGHFSRMSNMMAIWVPAGPNVKLTIGAITPLPGWSGYAVYMGQDIRRMAQQINLASTPLPATLTITDYQRQTGPMPWGEARRIRVKAKRVLHSGVAGLLVQSVIGTNQIRSSEWIGSTNNWVGQYLSVLADWSDGSVPLWNFTITAFDNTTGTMTVTPPCVRTLPADSVQAEDVMVVRARVTAATATTVTCALWRNSIALAQYGSDGLNPAEEPGHLIRVIGGTGKGQVRMIVSSTNDTHTIDRPWDTIPDTTSVIIVEDADWVDEGETSEPAVDSAWRMVDIRCRVANLADHVVLVGGFLVDDQGLETKEELAVYREIYVFGQPYQVRLVNAAGANPTLPGDQTMRVDTSTGDKTIELTEAGPYFGRSMLIVNDGVGVGAGKVIVKVKTGSGDEFQTREATVTIAKPGDWIEFVAGGDPTEIMRTERPGDDSTFRMAPYPSRFPQLMRVPESRPGRRPLPRSNQRGGGNGPAVDR